MVRWTRGHCLCVGLFVRVYRGLLGVDRTWAFVLGAFVRMAMAVSPIK